MLTSLRSVAEVDAVAPVRAAVLAAELAAAAGASATVSALPHSPQNLVPGVFAVPQVGHGAARRCPQFPQNLRPGSFSAEQLVQVTRVSDSSYRDHKYRLPLARSATLVAHVGSVPMFGRGAAKARRPYRGANGQAGAAPSPCNPPHGSDRHGVRRLAASNGCLAPSHGSDRHGGARLPGSLDDSPAPRVNVRQGCARGRPAWLLPT